VCAHAGRTKKIAPQKSGATRPGGEGGTLCQ